MEKALLSVGLDVGTSTTQLIVSRLYPENRASAFAVPEMVIGRREILFRSAVEFTPLIGNELVDGGRIRALVQRWYAQAGIERGDVDTGAIIITGETSRKENAEQVLHALSGYAGDFVVATAGPELESVLAAGGSGAVAYSRDTGKEILHIDIGGGTSNLARICDGEIVQTKCVNIGGRLVRFSPEGEVIWVSPAMKAFCAWQTGDRPDAFARQTAAQKMADALVRTAQTMGAFSQVSFSGGVAACIAQGFPAGKFGDLGPELAQAIRESALCAGEFRLGEEPIRATVIGAGCHSVRLSGSTVFCRGVALPVKNLPVAAVDARCSAQEMAQKLARQDTPPVLALHTAGALRYAQICALAEKIVQAFGAGTVYVAVRRDIAKALGQRIGLIAPQKAVLCIDGIGLRDGDYLDVGAAVGPAFPVVIKSLVFETQERQGDL